MVPKRTFVLGLLARLAEHNQGEIDWSCCLPVIFTRVQKMFSLPVYYSKINVGHKGTSLDSATAAKWIINTIGIFVKEFSFNFEFDILRWFQQVKSVSGTAITVCGILLPSSKYWQT